MRCVGLFVLSVVSVTVSVSACVDPQTVTCADGSLCPLGTACITLADSVQLGGSAVARSRCVSKDDVGCTPDCKGTCYPTTSGAMVCLAAGCGNGIVDADEACDDANAIAGDGCSDSCMSRETCGNGIIDAATGEHCDDGNARSHDGCSARCQDFEQARWVRHRDHGAPPPAESAVMAYDATRGNLVMFGGLKRTRLGTTTYGDTWIGEPQGGWTRVAPAASPTARAGTAMAYDAARRRTVLFGGQVVVFEGTGATLGDTWEWDGANWTSVIGAHPPARGGHAMGYDAVRGKLVLFGGLDAQNLPLTDTWEYDGAWKQVATTSAPAARTGAAIAFDPVRGRLVMFGGTLAADDMPTAETWTFDGAAWSRIAQGGTQPGARANPLFAWDPGRSALVVYGGFDASGAPIGAGYALVGDAWTAAPIAGPARADAAFTTDEGRRAIVMWGGQDSAGAVSAEFDVLTGNDLHGATLPDIVPPLELAASAYDPVRGCALMFGGDSGGGGVGSELYLSCGESQGWTTLLPTGAVPPARDSALGAYDVGRDAFVVYGGRTSVAVFDTWLWHAGAWSPQSGPAPDVQTFGAGMTYDSARGVVVLVGPDPVDAAAPVETWELDANGWKRRTDLAHAPGARSGSALGYDPVRRVVVMAGGQSIDETWEYDGTDWTQRTDVASPLGRGGASLVWNPARARLVLIGGTVGQLTVASEILEYDGTRWSFLTIANAAEWPARAGGLALPAADGRGIVVVGGNNAPLQKLYDDRWELAFSADGVADDACLDRSDPDGDGLVGCDDPDCWAICAPLCPPEVSCPASAPACGDHVCGGRETPALCPADCSTNPVCGDFRCDPGETAASCPGDCH